MVCKKHWKATHAKCCDAEKWWMLLLLEHIELWKCEMGKATLTSPAWGCSNQCSRRHRTRAATQLLWAACAWKSCRRTFCRSCSAGVWVPVQGAGGSGLPLPWRSALTGMQLYVGPLDGVDLLHLRIELCKHGSCHGCLKHACAADAGVLVGSCALDKLACLYPTFAPSYEVDMDLNTSGALRCR